MPGDVLYRIKLQLIELYRVSINYERIDKLIHINPYNSRFGAAVYNCKCLWQGAFCSTNYIMVGTGKPFPSASILSFNSYSLNSFPSFDPVHPPLFLPNSLPFPLPPLADPSPEFLPSLPITSPPIFQPLPLPLLTGIRGYNPEIFLNYKFS